jgi:hypothetical protein
MTTATTMITARYSRRTIAALALFAWARTAAAQINDDPLTPPPPNPPPPAAAPAPSPAATVTHPAPPHDRGAFIIGLKAGGLFAQPFSDLGTSFLVDVELGYALPTLQRGLVILLDCGYTQPTASGTQQDPRVTANGGSYTWELTQRELMFGATLAYRATWIGSGRVAPYLGVGPRLWLLQTNVLGQAGLSTISQSSEQSTKIGLAVPLGLDVGLGAGRIFIEVQLLWAPIDHRTTGDSSVGALTGALGYRLFL